VKRRTFHKHPKLSKYSLPVIRKVTIIESYKNLTSFYPAFEQSFEDCSDNEKKVLKHAKIHDKMALKRQN
jgi:hypothetical protein